MKNRLPLLLLLFVLTLGLSAQDDAAYRIEVDIEGYNEAILTLGYYMMDKQYIVDTASRSPEGTYVFESDTAALEPGIYLVVLSPDNNYFEVLVSSDDDQEFTLHTSTADLANVTVEGDRQNELFYEYLTFIRQKQEESAPYRQTVSDSTAAPALAAQARERLLAIDQEVKAYQEALATSQPDAFVSSIIRFNQSPEPPAYAQETNQDERQRLQWRWLQEHYFDGLNLGDPRLVRTPFLFSRVDYFINSLQVRHPDTLAAAIDQVLNRLDPQSEAYRMLVVHYTNEAATSKLVGMDALYVHMVDRYYGNGKAYWADEEQVGKMVDNANRLEPLLIGKKAPDLHMTRRDGSPINLYDVDAKYTVLYFWRYDCPACKKSTPLMKEFFEKYGEMADVRIFSVCTKGADEIGNCWDYVDEQGTGDWIQVADPYQRFYKSYDIQSTPAIFLLDEDKTIVSKRIGADQLGEVMDGFLQQAAAAGK
ncbi:peroxiredoxin [Neolewinella xylanilytica]|uniref:Peroxiredoxin n=1 Tax=Neolewinella xylanilytica TaxID=1514080 RepID=A0A2S6I0U8_9BACT|nr:TlpA disulfide reductase family protein [Neolewinella xylanilytica]PPK84397.1 peroxiredoxin [Neolewinella xylanilytica]